MRDRFQSTHSITECDLDLSFGHIFQIPISIHALHYRVRLYRYGEESAANYISIHALHYRVRLSELYKINGYTPISIHALHYRVRQPL